MLDDLRFRALFRRNRAEDDLDDELRFHHERAVERNVAAGCSSAGSAPARAARVRAAGRRRVHLAIELRLMR